jgi:single-strand DNA-binding protein
MFETTVTLVGRLITPLKQMRFDDGTLKVRGRMACTERRLDRASGQWIDGQTLYATVICRRGLAENAFTSLRSGDPVMAHGRLYTREYEKDGVPRSVTELDAWSLGPDLQGCTAAITKKPRAAWKPVAAAHDTPDGGEPGRFGVGDGAAEAMSGWEGGDAQLGDPTIGDGAGPDGAPTDDPWSEPAPAGARTGEAAVGV